MSSRNPTSNTSESRYTQRDRSPSRFNERRSSAAYSGGPLAARITDPIHRSNDAHGYPGLGREPQREPPRGPKALLDGPRAGGYGSRGRGYAGRGESRDREFREIRDPPISRRGVDRDWTRRGRIDSRESRPSPTGRNRSRSPLFRDSREFAPRELESNRSRRDSRDGPLSASSSVSEILPSTGFNNAGIFRGRGRGDWDYTKSGRGSYVEERDGFRNRSRSRERVWDKKTRDERDQREQEFSRRDDDSRKERDERERETDRHRRELLGIRPDSRNSTGTQATSSTPVSTSAMSSHQPNVDRSAQSALAIASAEPSRKPSAAMPTAPSVGRDVDRNDALVRPERERQPLRTASPPPHPQVPAFGSIAYRTNPAGQSPVVVKDRFKDEAPQARHSRSTSLDISREAPSGPKAIVLGNAPTGPKAGQPLDRPLVDYSAHAGNGSDTNQDRHNLTSLSTSTTGVPSEADALRDHAISTSNNSAQLQGIHENPFSQVNSPYLESQAPSRPKPLHFLQGSGRKDAEESNRRANPGFHSNPAASVNSTFPDTTSQPSPVKIPTGPRAERSASTLRPPASPPKRVAPIRPPITQRLPRPANLKWVRPGLPQHTPRGPSIMNTVPTKRDYAGEEKQRAIQAKSMELSWQQDNPTVKDASPARHAEAEQSTAKGEAEIDERVNEQKQSGEVIERQSDRFSPSEMRKSVESTELDVEDMELDDEEFAEDERKFELKMHALRLKRPPTPRHHPVLLLLLNEIDALASAADDLAKGTTGESMDNESYVDPLPLGLPSPKLEDADKTRVEETPMVSGPPKTARPPTPPVESLPFLISGPPTPFSELENRQEDPFHSDLIHARIIEVLGNQRERVASEIEDMKVDFARKYKQWRVQIEDYEDFKRAENPITPAPDSPTPAAVPLVTSAPIMEGRRSGKNVSELDLMRVLEESALTHKEEQERRNRETKIPVNHEKEAMIPQMLNRYELKACTFNDTNHLIDSKLALEAFGFKPKPDDFTAEEHEIFLDSYVQYPKKWGTIAHALKKRDYQDCVRHYYYTKPLARYKYNEKVFSRMKKGRRGGRAPQGRPKSTALMPTYDGTLDSDIPLVPVTDTGRPKRAAAPTFGDVADGEPATPVATPRRNAAGNKGEISGEMPVEKPSGKRGRTASVKEKGQKKTKAPLLAAAPGPFPQKVEIETARAKSKEPKVEGEQRIEEIEGAQVLAGFHSSQAANLFVNRPGTTESWRGIPPSMISVSNHAPKTQLTQVIQEPPPPPPPPPPQQQQQQPQRSMQPATSSYWSVPEQTDFVNLVQHFGTNWPAIANHMKSKTHTMVNSYIPCFSIR